MEYSKSFVTSIVLGKDVVPRIGLHQLEALRHDLIYAVHKSTDPKVRKERGKKKKTATINATVNQSWGNSLFPIQ